MLTEHNLQRNRPNQNGRLATLQTEETHNLFLLSNVTDSDIKGLAKQMSSSGRKPVGGAC